MVTGFPHSANELLVLYSLSRQPKPTERDLAMVWAYYRYAAWDLLYQYETLAKRVGEHPHLQLERVLITQTMQAWGFPTDNENSINYFDECCERAYANLSDRQRRGLQT